VANAANYSKEKKKEKGTWRETVRRKFKEALFENIYAYISSVQNVVPI
jgi:hypothetical protein